jgi:ribonuclease VapC
VILDSSAIVAILLKEAPAEELVEKLLRVSEVGIGSPTLAETAIVLSARLRGDARGTLSRFLGEASVITVPFGEAHYSTAVDAWLRFGKGRHPANLNFGDCLSYATAKVAERPLLCTGEDFAKTDLTLAI